MAPPFQGVVSVFVVVCRIKAYKQAYFVSDVKYRRIPISSLLLPDQNRPH
jgi:hypothetical protein